MHDRHPVAEPLGLVEVVGGEQDRHLALGPQPGDHVEQLVAHAGVEADGRLIEEEDGGPGDERPGDLQPPALAAAVGPDRSVGQLGEAEPFGHLGAPGPGGGSVEAEQAAVDLEVAPPGERPVDDGLLKHDGALAPGGQRFRGQVETGQAGAAGGGYDGRREHPDGGRLAGAVGPEQPEHLPGGDGEVDIPDGFHAAGVRLAQPVDVHHRWGRELDGSGHGASPLSRGSVVREGRPTAPGCDRARRRSGARSPARTEPEVDQTGARRPGVRAKVTAVAAAAAKGRTQIQGWASATAR